MAVLWIYYLTMKCRNHAHMRGNNSELFRKYVLMLRAVSLVRARLRFQSRSNLSTKAAGCTLVNRSDDKIMQSWLYCSTASSTDCNLTEILLLTISLLKVRWPVIFCCFTIITYCFTPLKSFAEIWVLEKVFFKHVEHLFKKNPLPWLHLIK